jgi:hypothetical protein
MLARPRTHQAMLRNLARPTLGRGCVRCTSVWRLQARKSSSALSELAELREEVKADAVSVGTLLAPHDQAASVSAVLTVLTWFREEGSVHVSADRLSPSAAIAVLYSSMLDRGYVTSRGRERSRLTSQTMVCATECVRLHSSATVRRSTDQRRARLHYKPEHGGIMFSHVCCLSLPFASVVQSNAHCVKAQWN